jgi:N-acyl-D-amino-acid deacylase
MSMPPPVVKYDLPAGSGRLHQQPIGIDATVKSGVVIMRHGEETGEMPGRLLRGPQWMEDWWRCDEYAGTAYAMPLVIQ